MCGLTGVLIGEGQTRSSMEKIRNVFSASLIANEERGRLATGVACVNGEGFTAIDKKPVSASVFVQAREFEIFMEQCMNTGPQIILGHTRRPTKGTIHNSDNNHPIIVGNIVGIHNGTITNDDEIFLSLERRKDIRRKRVGSVDSESIFALMDSINFSGSVENWSGRIQESASLLIGSYTTLFFNKKHPHTLVLLKYQNPISLHYSKELNALFFCSRYVFLRKAFGKAVITEAIPGKTGYVFDSQLIKENQKQPVIKFKLNQQKINKIICS